LGDLIEVSQKEVINFILQERSQPFSELEIAKIKARNFDIVKALQHATEEAKRAKVEGKDLSMDEILKYFQTPIVIGKPTSINRRGRKKKTNGPPDTGRPSVIEPAPNLAPEQVNKTDSVFREQDSRIKNNSPSLES
jgi:hypothetical protein